MAEMCFYKPFKCPNQIKEVLHKTGNYLQSSSTTSLLVVAK